MLWSMMFMYPFFIQHIMLNEINPVIRIMEETKKFGES